ncbi:MAG TPA: SdrD B-like domain-containing protein, partial [Isosphaeraceae bacterium]
MAPAAGTISGVVFNDLNGNGSQGAGEPGISGRTVFLDLNRDNLLDNGEPATTTGADGSYQFTALAAGTYLVGQVVPPGWKATAPVGAAPGERSVTLAAGSPYTFTFNSLASASDQTIPTYHENGYTFTTNVQQPGQFTVYGSSDTARYAGSPALSAEWAPSTITLSRDDGTPFTLTSMDLSTIWSSIYSVTVSFTGHRGDGTTVQ